MKCNYKNRRFNPSEEDRAAVNAFMQEVFKMDKSKRDVKETVHRGWKMVEYIDDMFGETFYNAELYDDKNKMMYHATTEGYMSLNSIQKTIDDYIEGKDEANELRSSEK